MARVFGPNEEINVSDSTAGPPVLLSGRGDRFQVNTLALPGSGTVPGVTWLANFEVRQLGNSSKYQIRLNNLPEGKTMVVYDVTTSPPTLKYSSNKNAVVVLDVGDPAVGIS